MDIENINNQTLDLLKELGNIGSGNAATALAKMISKEVKMDVPQVRILEFNEVTNLLGGEENLVVGIYFELIEEAIGNIMFVLDIKSAKNLSNMLLNKNVDSNELDNMDMSALSEVGNILASSYVNSLSSLTGLKLMISVPSLAIDMAGAILSVPAIQFGKVADHVLFIETQFAEGNNKVTGNFFLIPDVNSLNKILNNLGVNYNEGN